MRFLASRKLSIAQLGLAVAVALVLPKEGHYRPVARLFVAMEQEPFSTGRSGFTQFTESQVNFCELAQVTHLILESVHVGSLHLP